MPVPDSPPLEKAGPGRAPDRLVHLFAAATAACTLVLVVAGALVTSHDAGLAVPDWPTTYGHNMFTYPLSEMKGGIFYEHGHRLLGSLVGLLTVAFAVIAFARRAPGSVRWMAAAAVGLVIVQGVLGGLRVTRLDIDLAVVHGCVAQAFFSLVVVLAVVSHPSFQALPPGPSAPDAGRIRGLSILAAALAYVQVVAGAFLRHRGARLDVHVGLAFVVTAAIAVLAFRSWLPRSGGPLAPRPVRTLALGLALLVVLQLFLGLGSWATTFAGAGAEVGSALEIGFTVAHVAVGALIVAAAIATALFSCRLLGGATVAAPSKGRIRAAESLA